MLIPFEPEAAEKKIKHKHVDCQLEKNAGVQVMGLRMKFMCWAHGPIVQFWGKCGWIDGEGV